MKKLIVVLLIVPAVSHSQASYQFNKIINIDYIENENFNDNKDLLDISVPRKKKNSL